jgi:thiosulfate/3-mercaptopyruvate sulfurtransferase
MSKGTFLARLVLNWQTQLQDPVRRDIPSKERLEAILERTLGVSDTHTIVLYGDNNNWFAAYAFWVLKIYGHDDVRIMDGGRKKWLLEGRPITTEVPRYPPTQYRAKEPDMSLRAFFPQVLESLNQPGIALVDVRSPQEYTGELIAPPGMMETAQRGGHIPGARNIPWAQAVREDGTFKSPDELRALYEVAGHHPRQAGHHLLPNWRTLVAHLVRAEVPAGLPACAQLRRQLDGVGQHRRRAD